MAGLTSTTELVSAIAAPLVALGAIGATVWTTRRTLDDRREDRLWQPRADLYVDLVRAIQRERSNSLDQTLMAIDTLDRDPQVYWQSARDRDPAGWADQEVRVLAYASELIRRQYFAWDRALLHLAGVLQPRRVTGAVRPPDVRLAVDIAIREVATRGDELLATIREELLNGDRSSKGWLSFRRAAI